MGSTPTVLQLPISPKGNFLGVIDLVTMGSKVAEYEEKFLELMWSWNISLNILRGMSLAWALSSPSYEREALISTSCPSSLKPLLVPMSLSCKPPNQW